MMKFHVIIHVIALILITGLALTCTTATEKEQPGKIDKTYYYGVQIKDVICGYARITTGTAEQPFEGCIVQNSTIEVLLSLMGKSVDTHINFEYLLDSLSGKILRSRTIIQQENFKGQNMIVYSDDSIRYQSSFGVKSLSLGLPEGLEYENALTHPHWIRDFIDSNLTESSYKVFDEMRTRVVEKKCVVEGIDSLYLAGQSFHALKLRQEDEATGIVSFFWMDTATGLIIKVFYPGEPRTLFLTDASIEDIIKRAGMDNVIFYQVGIVIPEFKKIEFMKVRARINSAGQKITFEGLNTPGQLFTGTVTDNQIEGIFEMTTSRYDGDDAPAFPGPVSDDPLLAKYLKPEIFIESDERMIVHQAELITEEAADSWEAVIKLSRWVSSNIRPAIPGGGTALNTLKTREGECGGHSRLMTAFCRSLGIPARMVTGCMYVPDNDGYFGQHAWTEVYMGEAGWIPIDPTIGETDYIDAGHIRLGENTSFIPKQIEIVEYHFQD